MLCVCSLCSKYFIFAVNPWVVYFIFIVKIRCPSDSFSHRNRRIFMAPNVKCILMLCLFSISYMPDVWFCGLKCGVVDIVLELQQSKTPIYISWVACYFYVHLSLFGLTCMYCCECIHCIYVLICTDCWMYLLYLCIDLYWLLSNIYR